MPAGEGAPAQGALAPARLGSPRARLFVALDLPDRARETVARWRDEAIAGRTDLRPVAPEALHATLAFLGYQPEKDIARIAEVAFGALGGLAPPRLRATDVRPLPPRAPRLFALSLDDIEGGAAAVQGAVAGALGAARVYRPEKRPFWPHVTLARVKRGRRATALEAPPPPGEPFDATDVTLYRSVLRPEGASYEPLARYRLRG